MKKKDLVPSNEATIDDFKEILAQNQPHFESDTKWVMYVWLTDKEFSDAMVKAAKEYKLGNDRT